MQVKTYRDWAKIEKAVTTVGSYRVAVSYERGTPVARGPTPSGDTHFCVVIWKFAW